MTSPQRTVYDALAKLSRDGWPVTVREICAETGHASTATVHLHLQNLERAGLVEHHRRAGFRPTRAAA